MSRRTGAEPWWRITHKDGGQSFYPDEPRANEELAAYNADPKTAGATLHKVDPVTNKVLP